MVRRASLYLLQESLADFSREPGVPQAKKNMMPSQQWHLRSSQKKGCLMKN